MSEGRRRHINSPCSYGEISERDVTIAITQHIITYLLVKIIRAAAVDGSRWRDVCLATTKKESIHSTTSNTTTTTTFHKDFTSADLYRKLKLMHSDWWEIVLSLEHGKSWIDNHIPLSPKSKCQIRLELERPMRASWWYRYALWFVVWFVCYCWCCCCCDGSKTMAIWRRKKLLRFRWGCVFLPSVKVLLVCASVGVKSTTSFRTWR